MIRWYEVKRTNNLQNDREVATFLIDRFKHSVQSPQIDVMPGTSVQSPQIYVMPGTSKVIQGPSRLTSTPGLGFELDVVSTPSVSGVSGPETDEYDDREKAADVMSGIEEMVSPGDSISKKQMSPKASRMHSRPQHMKKMSSSFIDPSDISIDITQVEIERDSEEDIEEEDPDYEPSVLISSILPKELEEQCEDVAFEEAEFGLEREDDRALEGDLAGEEVVLDGVSYIKTEGDCHAAAASIKCICFLDQLKQLAKLKCEKCATCNSEVKIIESFIGSAVYLKWICKDEHVSLRWCSHPLLNRRIHCGDFLI